MTHFTAGHEQVSLGKSLTKYGVSLSAALTTQHPFSVNVTHLSCIASCATVTFLLDINFTLVLGVELLLAMDTFSNYGNAVSLALATISLGSIAFGRNGIRLESCCK